MLTTGLPQHNEHGTEQQCNEKLDCSLEFVHAIYMRNAFFFFGLCKVPNVDGSSQNFADHGPKRDKGAASG